MSSGTGGSAPAGWLCDAAFYGAGDGCDCGCGVVDADCTDSTAASCDYCGDSGSCAADATCPSNVDPTDSSKCVPVVCGDGVVGPGEECDDGNTASNDGCSSTCQIEAPAGWTCNADYYGGNDGCDCGCGLLDPDCMGDSTVAACDYCTNTGSCSESALDCPGTINPTNNAVCQ